MTAALAQGYEAFRELVNPLVAVRAGLLEEPYQLVSVDDDGALIDVDGRRVEDFLSGWGTQALGHRNARVAAAISEVLAGRAPTFFTSGVSPYAGLLARALARRTGYDATYFASGGSEVVEAALKLARGRGRRRVLCLEGAYHGCTFGSLAMMARGPFRDPFAPHLAAVEAVPFGDARALAAALDAGDVAAVVVEPVQIEAGVRALAPEAIAELGERTARAGALLVADEIQTGLGRCGRFLESEAWPRRPDVVVLGKALGGGLMPLSAMLTRRAIFAEAYGSHERAELHASTWSGNGLACAAGLAALELIDDALLARAAALGERLVSGLRAGLAGLPLVKEVRGRGLLAGIELEPGAHPWLTFGGLGLPELDGQPAIGWILCHRLVKAGFIAGVCGHAWETVRVQPALTIGEDRIDAFVDATRREVSELCRML
jgi:putrescine aminotransferase